jgi:hypothetical protein
MPSNYHISGEPWDGRRSSATQIPSRTLRVYAHATREEETDFSFLDFGGT